MSIIIYISDVFLGQINIHLLKRNNLLICDNGFEIASVELF